ncbi:MAG: galactokinase family protein [Blastocatellia bacterium]
MTPADLISPDTLPGYDGLVARLRTDERSFFDSAQPVFIARAPGRLDVMGGIADYSGATVCEMPIAEAALVALQWRDDGLIRVRTTAAVSTPEISLRLNELFAGGAAPDYATASARLAKSAARAWAAYIVGALIVLAREAGVKFTRGANLLVDSSVPLGKGVSSSAAIEVATLRALTAAVGLEIDGYDLAVLAQMVENRVAGAPCGLMDQLTSALGREDHLLCIRCQGRSEPALIRIPSQLHFIGIDSGVRHAVSGASYGDVRTAAFMGWRIIADHLKLKAEAASDGQVRIDDPVYGGYLTNIPPSVFQARYAGRLPERMNGAEFLERYGGITDAVTRVDANTDYAVRAAAAHPVEEEHRIRLFISLLESASTDDERLRLLGELMFQSHESYSRCGLGSDATDELVEAVRQAGPQCGLFGAKITGGGSGGTVAVLAAGEAGLAAAQKVAQSYARRRGIKPYLFRASSPGAMSVAVKEISLT